MSKIVVFVLQVILWLGILPGNVLAEGKIHEVVIPEGQSKFVPEVLTIAVGDTVKWINHDHRMDSHDFASVPGPNPENKEIKLTVLKPDESTEHTFTKPGEYRYFCYIHKGMIGKIIVK